jgi:demethylmenaquinone methyltransferase/2-methoxy-6-polyprenyl-1,4-benzoquinol methylase
MPDTSRRDPAPVWTAGELRGDPHEAQDKADRVRAMFASIATSYDLNNRVHSLWRDQAWRRAAVRLCGIGPRDRVLDVACGTGDLAEAFARARPASVTGLDFTPEMLQIARDKSRRHRLAVTPDYVQGDAMSLPFADESFDVVSIAFGIRNVTDPGRAIREFHRVLRDGGRLVILEFANPRLPVLRGLHRFYTTRIMPITATLLARDRSGAYRYLPRSVETFLSPQALAALARDAGLVEVSQHPMTFGTCVATVGRRKGVRD